MSSKFEFRFATMGSGKSAEIIQIVTNYRLVNMDGMVFIPEIDTASEGEVRSRNGHTLDAIELLKTDNIFELVKTEVEAGRNIEYVIVDESHFLTIQQVSEVTDIVDILDIDVLCYGLLTDSFGNLFPAVPRLLADSDKKRVLTIHRMCPCGKKALYNARIVNGEVARDGNIVSIKGKDKKVDYVPLCRKCYKAGKWKLTRASF